jgi:hypothetical protein
MEERCQAFLLSLICRPKKGVSAFQEKQFKHLLQCCPSLSLLGIFYFGHPQVPAHLSGFCLRNSVLYRED